MKKHSVLLMEKFEGEIPPYPLRCNFIPSTATNSKELKELLLGNEGLIEVDEKLESDFYLQQRVG